MPQNLSLSYASLMWKRPVWIGECDLEFVSPQAQWVGRSLILLSISTAEGIHESLYVVHHSTHKFDLVFPSDSVTRVNDSTRVMIFGDSDSTRVTLTTMMTRVKINDSWLVSESFVQHLWATDGQNQFVCTQRNEFFCFIDDGDLRKFYILAIYSSRVKATF